MVPAQFVGARSITGNSSAVGTARALHFAGRGRAACRLPVHRFRQRNYRSGHEHLRWDGTALSTTQEDLSARALAKNDWPVREQAGLPLICSPLLSELKFLVHAFTTRRGGTSSPPLDSFNLGRHW